MRRVPGCQVDDLLVADLPIVVVGVDKGLDLAGELLRGFWCGVGGVDGVGEGAGTGLRAEPDGHQGVVGSDEGAGGDAVDALGPAAGRFGLLGVAVATERIWVFW